MDASAETEIAPHLYLIRQRGQESGPFAMPRLRKMWSEKTIDASTKFKRTDWDHFVDADDLLMELEFVPPPSEDTSGDLHQDDAAREDVRLSLRSEPQPGIPAPLELPLGDSLEIHITRNRQRDGPYSLQEIRKLLKAGMLSPTDLAWHTKMTEWKPLNAFPALRSEIVSDFQASSVTSSQNGGADMRKFAWLAAVAAVVSLGVGVAQFVPTLADESWERAVQSSKDYYEFSQNAADFLDADAAYRRSKGQYVPDAYGTAARDKVLESRDEWRAAEAKLTSRHAARERRVVYAFVATGLFALVSVICFAASALSTRPAR